MKPSPVARAWLAAAGATLPDADPKRKGVVDRDALVSGLARHGFELTPELLALEETFGGVVGRRPDDRVLWIGIAASLALGDRKRPRVRMVRELWGQTRFCVGGFDPCEWWASATGEIVEVDDLGESTFASSSVAKRIEQLAHDSLRLGSQFSHVQSAAGAVMAKALALRPLAEPTDAWQRWWCDEKRATFVVELRAPSTYGARDLVTRSYVYARSKTKRDRAIAAVNNAVKTR
jgi:hypothetical protein